VSIVMEGEGLSTESVDINSSKSSVPAVTVRVREGVEETLVVEEARTTGAGAGEEEAATSERRLSNSSSDTEASAEKVEVWAGLELILALGAVETLVLEAAEALGLDFGKSKEIETELDVAADSRPLRRSCNSSSAADDMVVEEEAAGGLSCIGTVTEPETEELLVLALALGELKSCINNSNSSKSTRLDCLALPGVGSEVLESGVARSAKRASRSSMPLMLSTITV